MFETNRKKLLLFIFIFSFFCFSFGNAIEVADFSPKLGVYLGTITPILELSDDLNTGLGVSVFLRFFIPSTSLMGDFDFGYNWMFSETENELYLLPAVFSIVYRIPFEFPLQFRVKFGIGGVYEKIFPERKENFDPVARYGLEISFAAGNVAYIGAKVEHLFVYQRYIEDAKINGNFIYFGIFVYFNLTTQRKRI